MLSPLFLSNLVTQYTLPVQNTKNKKYTQTNKYKNLIKVTNHNFRFSINLFFFLDYTIISKANLANIERILCLTNLYFLSIPKFELKMTVSHPKTWEELELKLDAALELNSNEKSIIFSRVDLTPMEFCMEPATDQNHGRILKKFKLLVKVFKY